MRENHLAFAMHQCIDLAKVQRSRHAISRIQMRIDEVWKEIFLTVDLSMARYSQCGQQW